jgi:hypothetical protein
MSLRARRPRAVVSAATGVRGARAASALRVPQKGPAEVAAASALSGLRPFTPADLSRSSPHWRHSSRRACTHGFSEPELNGLRGRPSSEGGICPPRCRHARCLAVVESDSSSQGSHRAGERHRNYLAHDCGTDRPSQGQHTSRQQCPGGRRRSCEPGGTERCGLDVSCAPP